MLALLFCCCCCSSIYTNSWLVCSDFVSYWLVSVERKGSVLREEMEAWGKSPNHCELALKMNGPSDWWQLAAKMTSKLCFESFMKSSYVYSPKPCNLWKQLTLVSPYFRIIDFWGHWSHGSFLSSIWLGNLIYH